MATSLANDSAASFGDRHGAALQARRVPSACVTVTAAAPPSASIPGRPPTRRRPRTGSERRPSSQGGDNYRWLSRALARSTGPHQDQETYAYNSPCTGPSVLDHSQFCRTFNFLQRRFSTPHPPRNMATRQVPLYLHPATLVEQAGWAEPVWSRPALGLGQGATRTHLLAQSSRAPSLLQRATMYRHEKKPAAAGTPTSRVY